MKIFVSKDISKNPLMKSLVVFFLVFELLYIAGTVLMKYHEDGFSAAKISSSYRGSEKDYIERKSPVLLLEEVHVWSFFAAVLLLTTCAIFAVSAVAESMKLVLVYATSAGALTFILSGPFILYVSPVFSHVLIAAFILYHVGLCAMTALSLFHFVKR